MVLHLLYETSKQAHDVIKTSNGRRCDVMMSHQHHVPAGLGKQKSERPALVAQMKTLSPEVTLPWLKVGFT